PLGDAPQHPLIPGEKADDEVGFFQRISTQNESFADTRWHTWKFQSNTDEKSVVAMAVEPGGNSGDRVCQGGGAPARVTHLVRVCGIYIRGLLSSSFSMGWGVGVRFCDASEGLFLQDASRGGAAWDWAVKGMPRWAMAMRGAKGLCNGSS